MTPSPIGGGAYSLDEIHKAIKCLHAINQEAFNVLSECKEEWRHHPQLSHLVYDYHNICLQTYKLYYDFVNMLKGQCDIQLSVIMSFEERLFEWNEDEVYPNYKEMILCLNSDGKFTLFGDFMKQFAYICKQTVAFTRQFEEEILELKSAKSPLWKHEPLVIKDFVFASDGDMMIAMEKLSMKIEELSRHAHKCCDDIIKAEISLKLSSHFNRMLPIKHKR
ncbi:hypothetical protein L1987_59140 [Smallanthus sonchifolius]|uniref:Uncharacterized protein n=1 Tax=Smallanthus sonchifolius TaxID=185202 RepID=A0ACB9D4P2_9ASTR|nr:hypothetical protein L1987_59140 [Smallanthus sonchifolius]